MITINTAAANKAMNKNFTYDPENIADVILAQLGGHRFLIMTGAKNLMASADSLQMTLPRNASKANRFRVSYDKGRDSYTVEFWKHTEGRLNYKTGVFTPDKDVTVKTFEDIYWDQLTGIFEEVTGLYTSL